MGVSRSDAGVLNQLIVTVQCVLLAAAIVAIWHSTVGAYQRCNIPLISYGRNIGRRLYFSHAGCYAQRGK